jgi:hypothetical protein
VARECAAGQQHLTPRERNARVRWLTEGQVPCEAMTTSTSPRLGHHPVTASRKASRSARCGTTPHLGSVDEPVCQNLLQAHGVAYHLEGHRLIHLAVHGYLSQVRMGTHHGCEQAPDVDHAPAQLQLARVDGTQADDVCKTDIEPCGAGAASSKRVSRVMRVKDNSAAQVGLRRSGASRRKANANGRQPAGAAPVISRCIVSAAC